LEKNYQNKEVRENIEKKILKKRLKEKNKPLGMHYSTKL